jgi:hypothetical protein
MIEQTGEYMFYNVTFKSTSSGIIDTIELSTQVRRSVSHDIVITNPLNSNVTFSASTSVNEISLPSNFVVGPDSKVRLYQKQYKPYGQRNSLYAVKCLIVFHTL